jgi:phosphotransferase system HPr-like phosphotransfer protein
MLSLRYSECPDTIAMTAKGPRILFINSELDRREGSLPIIRALKEDYEVEERIELTRAAVDLVCAAERSGRPYSAIITHLPPGPLWKDGYPYGKSMSIVSDIAQSTEAAVIAYTAAAISDVRSFSFCVEEIVIKGRVQEDIVKLRELLARMVGRPRRREIVVDPPRVLHSEGRTAVEATVNLLNGIHLGVISMILKLCKDFDGEVILRKMEGEESEEEANAKEQFQLMMLAAPEGQRIVISVSGIGAAAETLARRLYAIVTSRFYWDVDLDRFVTPDSKAPTS